MGVDAWIGLGSNQQDPSRQVRDALAALAQLGSPGSLRASSLYLTPPWGIEQQASFINAVAWIHTELAAGELLDALLALERAAGRDRRRAERWGPRTLDLDLLVYGQLSVSQPGLEVPHPRIAQRAFVLVPLAELAPQLSIPGVGITADLLKRLPSAETAAIQRLEPDTIAEV